jgi:hypothetical protein
MGLHLAGWCRRLGMKVVAEADYLRDSSAP